MSGFHQNRGIAHSFPDRATEQVKLRGTCGGRFGEAL